ncbi:MAG: hypothetical protein KGZ58_13770 [Ignavibacteriales bacterium]|nr:hypothetical protein [Ignavibacteriales bacterium]
MTEIGFANLKTFRKLGGLIVAVFEIESPPQKRRSIVTDYDRKEETIETLYGTVRPLKLYACKTIKEAMDFINLVD